jgi:hypothetical protein
MERILVVEDDPAASRSFGILRMAEQRNLSRAHKNKYGQDYDIPTPGAIYTRP